MLQKQSTELYVVLDFLSPRTYEQSNLSVQELPLQRLSVHQETVLVDLWLQNCHGCRWKRRCWFFGRPCWIKAGRQGGQRGNSISMTDECGSNDLVQFRLIQRLQKELFDYPFRISSDLISIWNRIIKWSFCPFLPRPLATMLSSHVMIWGEKYLLGDIVRRWKDCMLYTFGDKIQFIHSKAIN